jgi:hypothetical protein
LKAEAASATTIYLKWDSRLSPRQLDQHWDTGDSELNVALNRFAWGMIKPAIQGRMNSDPQGLRRILRLELLRPQDLRSALDELRKLRGAVYAEAAPERSTSDGGGSVRQVLEVPGDPLYGDQWFYPLMQAPAAWDLTHSDASVVVAIVDNGTDWDHPDLSANIWQNAGESDGDGVDNDQNGYIDDIRGWDYYGDGQFMDNNPAPESSDYHGTHTAGLVGAVMNNGRGVVGMAPACKVMPVRTGTGSYIYFGLEGITYAAHNGADIISLSWGGQYSNSYERDVINDALAQGCLVVAAAGNSGSSYPHYPAGYDGVLSVAMTDPTDVRVSNSNYGDWVRVCAPGLDILSLIPDGYGYSSGTSMATPLVAGVGALVKAYHPTWSAQQIFSQIVNTADDISSKNPLYIGLLGSGRVNAYRALAETAPGLVIQQLDVSEISGDNDGRLDPDEQAELILTIKNEGAATANVQITVNFTGFQLTIGQSLWIIPDIGAGETVSNAASPYTVSVSPFATADSEMELIFSISAEDFYSSSINWPVWISPAFADHDTGSVALTMTNFGQIGYQKYTDLSDPPPASGFYFPQDGPNALYLGSLMAAVSSEKVSDCAYGGSNYYEDRFDWQIIPTGDLALFPGTLADQEGSAIFKDSGAPSNEQIGLAIFQHSYAWSQPPRDDFVIVSYTAKNVSLQSLSNLYLGLYMDWDLIFSFDNEAAWDPLRNMGYMYSAYNRDADRQYYAASLLEGSLASFRVMDIGANPDYPTMGPPVKPRMSDSTKYAFMSEGMIKTSSVIASDHATLLTAGPYSLAVGDCVQVVFAVLAGENLADLRANADSAQAAWNSLAVSASSSSTGEPEIQLLDVFPRPANGDLHFSIRLAEGGKIAFSLLDILGRSTPIWQDSYPEAGIYRLALPRQNLASGVYWLIAQGDRSQSSAKIVWLK